MLLSTCVSPKQYDIPAFLVPLIQDFVTRYPILHNLSVDLRFANQLKRGLLEGKLAELHQRFGLPYKAVPPPPPKNRFAMSFGR